MAWRWVREVEDFAFDAAAALEHRLGLAPRATRIVPRPIDRYLVRVAGLALPLLCTTFLLDSRQFRARAMLGILAVALVVVIGIFVREARRTRTDARSAAARRPPTS